MEQQIEQPTALAPLKKHELEKAEIIKMVEDYSKHVSTDENVKETKAVVATLRNTIYAIQNVCKDNVSAIKVFAKTMVGEQELHAEELIALLQPLKEDFDGKVKAIEERKRLEREAKAQAEADRVAKIRSEIDGFVFDTLEILPITESSARIEQVLEAIRGWEITQEFHQEFYQDALFKKNQLIQKATARKGAIMQMELDEKKRQEEAEKLRLEQEKLDKERKEFEEKQAKAKEEADKKAAAEAAEKKRIADAEAAEKKRLDDIDAAEKKKAADELAAEKAKLAKQRLDDRMETLMNAELSGYMDENDQKVVQDGDAVEWFELKERLIARKKDYLERQDQAKKEDVINARSSLSTPSNDLTEEELADHEGMAIMSGVPSSVRVIDIYEKHLGAIYHLEEQIRLEPIFERSIFLQFLADGLKQVAQDSLRKK